MFLVEDDPAVGQVLEDACLIEGYEVRWARNGRDALDVLRDWCPEVILLDLMMPVMDGWQFRAEQRRMPGGAGTLPVIVLSGAHDARERARELDAAEIIEKPFDLNELLAALARVLQQSRRSG